MKLKLKFFLPLAVLLLSPWTHRLLFANFKLAWPLLQDDTAHMFSGLGAFAAVLMTWFIIGEDGFGF